MSKVPVWAFAVVAMELCACGGGNAGNADARVDAHVDRDAHGDGDADAPPDAGVTAVDARPDAMPDAAPGVDAGGTTAPVDCSSDGWCIELPRPVAAQQLSVAYASSANDVWLFGSLGAAARRTDGQWHRVDAGMVPDGDVVDADGNGPDDVWAITASSVHHWDGTTWSEIPVDCVDPSAAVFTFESIAAPAPDDVWLGGFRQDFDWNTTVTTCRWNGVRWTLDAAQCEQVSASSTTNVWCDLRSYWDGAAMVPVPGGAAFAPRSVWTDGANDVWAVDASNGSPLVHWDGTSFTTTTLMDHLQRVDGTGPDDVWAVGWDGILHWDGTTLAAVPLADPTIVPTTIAATTSGAYVGAVANHILRYGGASWAEESVSPLYSPRWVAGTSATDVWVGGNYGLAHYDGATWTNAANLPLDVGVYSLLSFATDDVWGVVYDAPTTTDELARFDGAWTTTAAVDLPLGVTVTARNLMALSGPATDDLWLAGYDDGDWLGSSFIAHWDGALWSRVAVPTPGQIKTIWSAGGADVWAMLQRPSDSPLGYGSTIAHWDGASWTTFESPTRVIFDDVFGLSNTDVWTCGRDGVLFHYDGAWTQIPSGTTADLLGLWGDANGLWVVGGSDEYPLQEGVMLEWNGTDWQPESLPTTDTLTSVHAVGPDLWTVGAYVLRRPRA
jgi:hypothetical protein